MKSNWFHTSSLSCLLFVSLLFTSFLVNSNDKGVDYLLQQLSYQMGQRNLFQAEKTLNKISKVSPDNLIYLQENVRFLVEAARLSEARIALMKIKNRLSDKNYTALLQLHDIYYTKRLYKISNYYISQFICQCTAMRHYITYINLMFRQLKIF